MRRLLLVVTLIAVTLPVGFAQKRVTALKTRGLAVAFFDEVRLKDQGGQASMESFEFFLKQIQEIVKRDFPDVEFRVLRRGELLQLPDGTALNVQNLQPKLGYVLSQRGRKRRMLDGVQSETDFACAAGAFFRRSSSACTRLR
jgi:hypothetical protein